MKVILGVDPVFYPLTGIGRYTLELASGLEGLPDIEELRFFNMGRWVDNPARCRTTEDSPAGAAPAAPAARLFGRLRARLAANSWATRAYAQVSPAVFRWRLKDLHDHIFHAPAFLVPPFDGGLIATVHDLSTVLLPAAHPPARVRLMEKGLEETFARADRIIVHTGTVQREIVDTFGFPADRVSVVMPGVSSAFYPRDTRQLQPVLAPLDLQPGAYILCVATIEPRKNIGGLIDAYLCTAASFRESFPLVIVGARGWNSEALHRRIERLAQAGQVRYLNYVPESLLPQVIAGARLFAFPSFYEGFGLPVLEAMACGVPVVTSTVSCLPEVAGGAALLVHPHDVAALAEMLQQGALDDAWRCNAISAGRLRAASATWLRTASTCVEAYRKVALEHAGASPG